MPRFNLSSRFNPKLLIWAGYVGYFLFCFVTFSYLMFPYDRLQEYAKQQVAAHTGGKDGAPMKLDIGSISPYWPPGVALHDVEVDRPGKGSDPALQLKLDSITARLKVLPLLVGTRALSFSAEQGAGSLAGSVAASEARTELDLEFDAMDAEALGLGGFLQLPIKGQLDGDAVLALSTIPTETDGDVTLTIQNLQLGDGKAKVPVPGMRDGITVERINAGTLTMNLEIRQGVVEIKALTTDGPDLKLNGTGNIKLAEDLERSRLDVTLELTFSEAYKARNDRTKAIFQLISFQPELKSALTAAGGLSFKVTGSLSAPRGKPAGGGRAVGRAGPARRARGK
jgi:type II secretion system protein N